MPTVITLSSMFHFLSSITASVDLLFVKPYCPPQTILCLKTNSLLMDLKVFFPIVVESIEIIAIGR